MTKKEYTEQEILAIAIKKGLSDGAEIETKNYKEKGFIDSGKQLEIFIEKLEQGFESVELKLNPKSNKGKGDRPFAGKKRVYIVGSEKEVNTERKDGRENNGREITIEESIFMDEVHLIIQNEELLNQPLSLTSWAYALGLKKLEVSKELQEKINQTYEIFNQNWFDSTRIVEEFVRDYNKKMNTLIANSFKRLQTKGLIEYIEQPYGVKDEVKTEITHRVYRDFYNRQKELIEQYDYRYQEYMELSSRLTQAKYKMAKVPLNLIEFSEHQKEIQSILVEEFGYEFTFMSYNVTEINEVEHTEV